MNETMDNQLSLDEKDLYYFAGLLDGEGTVTLMRTGTTGKDGLRPIVPQIKITNTDPALIQFSVDMFVKMGAKPLIYAMNNKPNKNWNIAYTVLVAGIKKTTKVLSIMSRYLLAKKQQAELILEFDQIRIALNPNRQCGSGRSYGERELQIFDLIRALNRRGLTETGDGKYQTVRKFDIKDSPNQHESVEVCFN